MSTLVLGGRFSSNTAVPEFHSPPFCPVPLLSNYFVLVYREPVHSIPFLKGHGVSVCETEEQDYDLFTLPGLDARRPLL
jgi:hypothetical protein